MERNQKKGMVERNQCPTHFFGIKMALKLGKIGQALAVILIDLGMTNLSNYSSCPPPLLFPTVLLSAVIILNSQG